MTSDEIRNCVLAGLQGLIMSGKPTEAYVAKHTITPDEFQEALEAALHVCMQFMGRQKGEESEAPYYAEKVSAIAHLYQVSRERIVTIAWNVLHKCVQESEPEHEPKTVFNILKYFLISARGPILPEPVLENDATQHFLQDKNESEGMMGALIFDLALNETVFLSDYPGAKLLPDIQELFEEVGLSTT